MQNKVRLDLGDQQARRQLKEILEKNKTRLSISRVPKKTRETFIELAKEEFEEDYGMLLKWLLDQALEYQMMKERLVDLGTLEARVSALEEQLKFRETQAIKLLDGSIIKKSK